MEHSFQERVFSTFERIKNGHEADGCIRYPDIAPALSLSPVTLDAIGDPQNIALMTAWRQRFQHVFPSQFPVSEERTARWAVKLLHERPDRILFFVVDADGRKVGHLGLSSFDFEAGICEIDNVIRGCDDAPKGIMQAATEALVRWTFDVIAPRELHIQTGNDNTRALALYLRCGFLPFDMTALKHVPTGEGMSWVEAGPRDPVGRLAVHMRYRPQPGS